MPAQQAVCLVKCRRGSKLPVFMFTGMFFIKYLCQICCPLPEKNSAVSAIENSRGLSPLTANLVNQI